MIFRPLLAALLLLPTLSHAETCRFAGTTSHDGHLSARVDTAQAGDVVTVDAAVEFTVRAWMTDYRYLGQEITRWRGTELLSVAVNQRYLADGEPKRQQWDVFTRNGTRLEGSRLQAKYLSDFRQRYPRFVPHWSPASFGQPWLADWAHAGAERRPDLDLPATDVRTPLAFALYWSRFLPPGGSRTSLVLPSFKHDKQLPLDLAPTTSGDGWRRWSTPLHHPALASSPASLAAAWVSPDDYLLQLAFDLHTSWANGQVLLRAQGCQGVQLRPG